MKRKVLLLLSVLFMFSFILGGCGSSEPKSALEGTTWVISSGKDDSGIELTSDLLALAGIADFTLEFKADEVLTASYAEESADGTWSEKDNVVTIGLDGESITANVEGEQLTLAQEGMTLYFDKQK